MVTCGHCNKAHPDGTSVCDVDGHPLPSAPSGVLDTDLPEGSKAGEYQILGKLGEGGFGAVYRAVHPLIGKAAAVKVLNHHFSADPQMVSRFMAEARAVNQIRHRNIIDIFSFGQLPDGRHYFVMEYLDGKSLDKVLSERGRLSPDEALPILKGVTRALTAAHAGGIAHRDLKPENILLARDDEGQLFPKLIDFGIAKLLGDSSEPGHKTETGTPMGTSYYMSPEQCRGKRVDHRTDIYACGVLVHVMLTGKRPFDGESVMDILLKQITDPPPRMSEVCPDLPSSLDEPVLQMLAKDPEKRPQTASAAYELLEAAWGKVPVRLSGAPAEHLPTSSPSRVSDLVSAKTEFASSNTPPVSPGPPRDSTGQTLEPASKTSAPIAAVESSPKSRKWLLVSVPLAGVVGAAAVFAVLSGGAGGQSGSVHNGATPASDRASAGESTHTVPPPIVAPAPMPLQSADAQPTATAASTSTAVAKSSAPASSSGQALSTASAVKSSAPASSTTVPTGKDSAPAGTTGSTPTKPSKGGDKKDLAF
ncbi:MAG: serine/threonine protein kinase [Polyangiaceae bacterium]|nr:serine/threonine protein kinase [Polyangiaceae bacterium]